MHVPGGVGANVLSKLLLQTSGLIQKKSEECRNPNHHYFSKKYRNTTPICIAIRLQFVSQYLWCPYALRKGKYCQYSSHLYRSTPPICIAIRLPFVSQYFWGNLGGCGHRDVPQKRRKFKKAYGLETFAMTCFSHLPNMSIQAISHVPTNQGGKRAQRLAFWVRIFHLKGWCSKSLPPSKVFLFLGLEGRNLGCPGNFVGISRTAGGVRKDCAKKSLLSSSPSLHSNEEQ